MKPHKVQGGGALASPVIFFALVEAPQMFQYLTNRNVLVRGAMLNGVVKVISLTVYSDRIVETCWVQHVPQDHIQHLFWEQIVDIRV